MAIWALSPLVLFFDPTLFGVFTPWASPADFMRQVAKIWLAIGIGGVLFRTVHLFFVRDVETGLVWMTKILTDPFNDLKLYYKAPLYLMKGELIDPGLGQVRVRKARSKTSAGRSSRMRRIRSLRPQTTPTGRPPARLLP